MHELLFIVQYWLDLCTNIFLCLYLLVVVKVALL